MGRQGDAERVSQGLDEAKGRAEAGEIGGREAERAGAPGAVAETAAVGVPEEGVAAAAALPLPPLSSAGQPVVPFTLFLKDRFCSFYQQSESDFLVFVSS